MEENQSHLKEYQTMAPQQRNAEMLKIFSLLPDFDVLFKTSDWSTVIDHRDKSDLKQSLVNRLKDLLTFAQVTESFRLNIVKSFTIDFEIGITKEEADANMGLYCWDNPKSGGIFDRNVAKELERMEYGSRIRAALKIREKAMRESSSDEDIARQEKEKFLKLVKPMMSEEELKTEDTQGQEHDDFMQRWRKEFIENYGETP